MREPKSWDVVWMGIAETIAERSKDPRTQVGAIVVSPDNTKYHLGYNGFPKKIHDTPERWEAPAKYERVIHAEANAILFSKCNLDGWTLYVTMFPCSDCTKMIIQSGISRVVYRDPPTHPEMVKANLSSEMLLEANIAVEQFSGSIY